jgi:phenylpyruvate tautomerase PptA (4-oxalocrotonate tautomerase family)
MAVARIETAWHPSGAGCEGLIGAVRAALVESLRVPADDPAMVLTDHPDGALVLPGKAGDRFTMITISLFAGRTLDTKRRLYQAIVERLGRAGVPPDDVLIVLNEIPMTDWGIEGGVPACEVDVGFQVEI